MLRVWLLWVLRADAGHVEGAGTRAPPLPTTSTLPWVGGPAAGNKHPDPWAFLWAPD